MSLIAIEASLPALRPSRRIARMIIATDDRARTRARTTDRFGLRHSSNEAGAVVAFETAVLGLAAHKPSTGADLARALASDPLLVAGHAVKGFANLILAREELLAPARQAHAEARAALDWLGGGTADERILVRALGEAVEGRFARAAMALDEILQRNPRAFLPAKIAHALRFMLGDAPGMLAASARVLRRYPADAPGYGFVLGCHALALEETGDLDAAERVGRQAVELEPEDAWGLHAVSHVHEMQGRTREGIAWLEGSRPVWMSCNNFSFHMAWHLALFHLEAGEHERVLAIYDRQVRPQPTDDFRDVANAVSLLWRLEQEGVPVGGRWGELGEIAMRRRRDVTLTFACLHNLLALIATGEIDAAWDLVRALELSTEQNAGDQPQVMDAVGIELATALLDLALNRAPRSDFAALAHRLPRIGGSHAQRDVFVRTLAEFAASRGDSDALATILGVRRRMKRDDRITAILGRRLAEASWDGRHLSLGRDSLRA
jgi:tetratricopeptide (TPR) repeat protein